MNKVMLIGNLTRDPEAGQTASGISYCRFSIAVNRRFSSKDGNNEVDYINIVTWRNTADLCAKSLSKGKKVGIVGSIQTRSYEAQDGTKRTAFDVVADEVEFLTPLGAREDAPVQASASASKKADVTKLEQIDSSSEDLPF